MITTYARPVEQTSVLDALSPTSSRLGTDGIVLLDPNGAVLVFPAASATTAQLVFAIRHSSGLIHAAMPSYLLDKLRIPDQPVLDSENSGTSFTVAVDAATGIGTGISARDRAHTLRVLADRNTTVDDILRPGHVLPIRCDDGGFRRRPRCWELAVDLVRASGFPPVAVAARLVDNDGEPLDKMSATGFALRHNLRFCDYGQPAALSRH